MGASKLNHTRSALGRLLRGERNRAVRTKIREFAERRAGQGDGAVQILEGILQIWGTSKRNILSQEDRSELLGALGRDIPLEVVVPELSPNELLEAAVRQPLIVEGERGLAPRRLALSEPQTVVFTPPDVTTMFALDATKPRIVGRSVVFPLVGPAPAPQPEAWMQSAFGGALQIEAPEQSSIHIEEIAHALARICRFGGHIRPAFEIYSVAQHSVLVSHLVPKGMELIGLLHDAAEYVVGDVPRPLKALLPGYKELERTWALAIGERFGLGDRLADLPAEVKHADAVALATERRDVMVPCERPWLPLPDPTPWGIYPNSVREAERDFLDRFVRLMAERGERIAAAAPAPFIPNQEKGGRVHDTEYMLAVKKLPCAWHWAHDCNPDENGEVQAAHDNRGRGVGTKSNDDTTIPLCANAHALSDKMEKEERRRFWDEKISQTRQLLGRTPALISADEAAEVTSC